MKLREAVCDATRIAMERDPSVFVIGVGIIDPRKVWGTLAGIREQFGDERFVECGLAEDSLTGAAIGAATLGMRPIIVHHRIDFVLLTMNQLINHAAKWPDMFGRQQKVPIVVRAVVGRGWGNGPQHTQSLHALFAHVPGMKAVVPTTPADAKGLLLASIEDDEPVIFIEHRWLHEDDAHVPAEYFVTPLGKAAVARPGSDVTIAAIGPMVAESLKAAAAMRETGISAEVIDMRTLRPLDSDAVVRSVTKTGRLVVAEGDWAPCSVGGEIVARVAEQALTDLKSAPARVMWPDICVPSSQAIEPLFYPGAKEIQETAFAVCDRSDKKHVIQNTVKKFDGPF